MDTCFIVQGFGKKTDYTDGRVLDLDASYEIIKEAVESAGLQCIRADEIVHSGTIDVPMYEQLLRADLVIADLSTYNVNAAFELGVRYGLRPHATIIVAEEQFKNPFDVGHIVIRRYKHLGEEIGYKEAKRFREELKQAIQDILANPKSDSPVYTFLPQLLPPKEAGGETPVRSAAVPAAASATPAAVAEAAGEEHPSAKVMLESALAKINAEKSDLAGARVLLAEVKKLRPNDPFVIQQLALATYKSKQPDPEAALHEACNILRELSPETSNDPETLGLWGAIHKRLWDLTASAAYLDESISAYERGFFLKQDYYNGINLAFLLNQRAVESLKAGQRDEAIADTVRARRVRQDVIRYAAPLAENKETAPDKRYWVIATLWEAAVGLGDDAATARWEAEAKAMRVADWMQETRESQGKKLQALLQTYAGLVNE
ncbi:MAG TPA: TRAFs-binding domain-containing protein [Methylococcaceae bacterium]|nr:TRAFs-binding domain-containing protein [Methylococcaceae bacterium]